MYKPSENLYYKEVTDRKQSVWKRAIRTWAICRCLLEKREPRVQRNIGTLFHQRVVHNYSYPLGNRAGKETIIKTRPRPFILKRFSFPFLFFLFFLFFFFFRFWFFRSTPINNSGKRIKDRGSISRQDYTYTGTGRLTSLLITTFSNYVQLSTRLS